MATWVAVLRQLADNGKRQLRTRSACRTTEIHHPARFEEEQGMVCDGAEHAESMPKGRNSMGTDSLSSDDRMASPLIQYAPVKL